jgi:hypothetical protein
LQVCPSKASRFLVALLMVFALDVVFLHAGLYNRLIEPDSSVGIFRFRRNLALSKVKGSQRLVALVGDSRIQDAFSARIFDQIAGPTPYRALNLGVPASSLRVWYYLLKEVDPHRNAFDLIVIPLASYSDADEWEDYTNRVYDLRFLTLFSTPSELLSLSESFTDLNAKFTVAIATVFKSNALKSDIRDFLSHPLARLACVSRFEKTGEEDFYRYEGRHTSLLGMEMSGGTWVKGGSSIDDSALRRLNSRVSTAPPPQTGMRQRYNSLWLNRLVDAYTDSQTKILLIKMPTDPVARAYPPPRNYSSLNSIATKKNVFILPEDYFSNLNTPQYFGDDVHLNSQGMAKFSERLSEVILGTLSSEDSIAQIRADL